MRLERVLFKESKELSFRRKIAINRSLGTSCGIRRFWTPGFLARRLRRMMNGTLRMCLLNGEELVAFRDRVVAGSWAIATHKGFMMESSQRTSASPGARSTSTGWRTGKVGALDRNQRYGPVPANWRVAAAWAVRHDIAEGSKYPKVTD